MDLLSGESIFILLGALVGFGHLLTSLIGCLFTTSGSTALRFVMVPIFLCYLYNITGVAFYCSHIFISYLPEPNRVLNYIHNGIKLILSVVITVFGAKTWEAFRNSAHCIRFSECDENYMFAVHAVTNFTDLICGGVKYDWSNDGCRRWIAQIPLITLSLLSIVVIHAVGQLWDDKFGDPANRTVVKTVNEKAEVTAAAPPPTSSHPPPSPVVQAQDQNSHSCSGCNSCRKCDCCCPHRPCCCPCHSCPPTPNYPPYPYERPHRRPGSSSTRRKSSSRSKSRPRSRPKARIHCDDGYKKKKRVSLERVLRDTIRH